MTTMFFNHRRLTRISRVAAFLPATVAVGFWVFGQASGQEARGTLVLSIVEPGAGGKPIPARVEVIDQAGNSYFAEDALLVGGDCVPRGVPWKGTLADARKRLGKKITDPYSTANYSFPREHFYSAGRSRILLPRGDYHIRVFKGPEFAVQTRDVTIADGKTINLKIELPRWINLPKRGWYSSDGHLHIARPYKELDPVISQWMQAEDIHVANTLQWGNTIHFGHAPQHSWGADGVHRDGDYLVVSGQENPRTAILGHGIIYGSTGPINFPDSYLIYRKFWEEARRQHAVSGYAHYGRNLNTRIGLAIDLPQKLLSFIEVLQADKADYDIWYDALNSGFRLTATAGSDYSCGAATFPGRERFYTKVAGRLTYPAWLEGVRQGRTFVTNGPMLEFRVNGKDIGDEIVLQGPTPLSIEARVSFDPARDHVWQAEVIQDGRVIKTIERAEGSSEISAKFTHEVTQASWLALRVSGRKLGESDFFTGSVTAAHTGAIYVVLDKGPGIEAHPRAKALARVWHDRLTHFEKYLANEQIAAKLAATDNDANYDNPKVERVLENRLPLQEAVNAAKSHYQPMIGR